MKVKNLFSNLFILIIITCGSFVITSCDKNDDKDDDDDDDEPEIEALSTIENGILGTWYYYSNSYSEYRCITFNNDRTACYFEVSKLSSNTKENQKCYTDWYVDEESVLEGSIFDVYIIGDNTGGEYWAGYTINTDDWILRKSDGLKMTETSKISCDFCD
ncbi:MAG: hypothetical protein JXB49_27330 [Bacteroidales bacterium]|nr:hypothetical protein [Bacteroidales bacterium]